jgi:hypothetical protein
MTPTDVPLAVSTTDVSPSAVVWIDDKRALIAAMSPEGNISTCDVDRGSLDEAQYVAQVVHVIGDRERVVILGPSDVRLALEREYVSIYRRPERLIDVEPAVDVDMADLLGRLRTLATWR